MKLSKFKKIKKKTTPLLLGSLIVILPVIYLMLKSPAQTAAWFNDSWKYRTKYTITNSSAAINAERKVLITVDTATLNTNGKIQSSCNDFRFTTEEGELLDYFIDSSIGACGESNTKFYVKVSNVIAGKQNIYMYYGNPSAPDYKSSEFFAPNDLGFGLRGYWKMEENVSGNGQTIKDYAHTNDGTTSDANASGMDCTVTGKIGSYACSFDNTDDYIDAGDPADGDFDFGTGDFGISVWFTNNSSNEGEFLVSKVNSGANSGWHVRSPNSVNYMQVGYDDGASPGTANGSTDITDGQWHHLVATRSGDNTYLYLDGNLEGSGTGGDDVDISGSEELYIGARYSTNNIFYNGYIDDVMVFGDDISADEVARLYNNGAGLDIDVPLTYTPDSGPTAASEETTPGPIAFWKFDEGTDNTCSGGVNDVCDSSGQGYDGANTNGPTWKDENLCVSGRCLEFDGSNQYIALGSSQIIGGTNLADDFTISLWHRSSDQSGDVIFSQGNTGNSNVLFEVIAGPADAGLTFNSRNTAKTNYQVREGTGAPARNDDRWHHYVVSRIGTTLTLYVDGLQVAQSTSYSPSGTFSFNQVVLGHRVAGSLYINGFLDEVKLYNYGRSAAQVKADYLRTSQGSSAVLGAQDTSFLNDGLVGYWKMDESTSNTCGTNTDVCDSSGNSNDISFQTAPTQTSGKFGRGLDFENSNSQYMCVDSDDDNVCEDENSYDFGTQSFSVSIWFNRESNPTTNLRILSKGAQTNSQAGYAIAGSDEVMNFVVGDGTARNNTAASYTGTGEWHHFVGVLDRETGKVTAYIDGELGDTTELTLGSIDSTYPLRIGVAPTNQVYWDGKLDELRFYNRALSPAEITALYNWAPGPVAHYKFDENTGTTAYDTTNNSYNGTLGVDGAGTDVPTWTTGKYGSALDFDGTDDWVHGGSSALVSGQAAATVETWVKFRSFNTSAVIFTEAYTNNSYQYVLRLYESGGSYYFSGRGRDGSPGTTAQVDSTTALTLDTWYHVAFVYDSVNDNHKLYINGIEDASSTTSVGALGSSVNHIGIGCQKEDTCSSGGVPNQMVNGVIDDLRVYNYARTNKQIIQDMNAGHPAVGSPVGSPIAYYSFDEMQGQTINNKGNQGSSLNGTRGANSTASTDDPTWTDKESCVVNGCLTFDGSNDIVNMGDPSGGEFDFGTNDFSVSVWFSTTSTGSNGFVVSKLDSVGDNGWDIRENTNDVAVFNIDAGGAGAQGTTNVNDGNWHHVVGVKSGDNAYIYVDGVLEDTGTGASALDVSGSEYLYVGSRYSNFNTWFDGKVDELKLYNYALTADEIKTEYNQSASINFGTGASSEKSILNDGAGNAPVAHYKFNEGVDNTCAGGTNDVCDVSGNGKDGAFSGNPVWKSLTAPPKNANGLGGKVLELDGSADYISVDSPGLPTTDFTYTAWVYLDDNNDEVIIQGTNNSGENEVQIYVDADETNGAGWKWRLAIDNNNTAVTSATTITTGEWHHIAATRSGSTAKLFLDGVEDASGTEADTLNFDSCALLIGVDNDSGCNGSLGNYMDGQIDEVKIYDYALTAAQVNYEYNRGKPLAWYRFDECQGTTTYDATGNGRHGTLSVGGTGDYTSTGTCSSGTSTEAWNAGTTGKYSASLDFDGTDDGVTLPDNSPQWLPTKNFTLGVWVKPDNYAGGTQFILDLDSQSSSTDTRDAGIRISIDSAQRVQLTMTTTGAGASETTFLQSTLPDDEWSHLTAVRIDGNVYYYLNGVLNVTGTVNDSNLDYDGDDYDDNTVNIGYFNRLGGSNPSSYFDGQIDDVRIYNYGMSADQIKQLYNNTAVSFQ